MKSLFFVSLLFLSAIVCSAQPAASCADETKRADRAEARLKDWPQLGRYHDANASVSAPAKNVDRVVFLGDSITDGWKLDQYFPGKGYINRGISGQTTPQMLIRFRPDVIDLKPKIVVILAGTNDLAGNTGPTTIEAVEGNLASIAELAHVNHIYVVFASVLPVSDYNKDKEGKPIIQTARRQPEKILALNAWMKKYAADNGLGYLDYFSAMVDERGFLKPDIARDGLHPNEKGYEVMAPLAAEAIARALRQKAKR
jgi:lysophospholipase L1-like esterase